MTKLGTVTKEVFWNDMFDRAEKDGETLRVGDYRVAPINDFWCPMKDGASYPVNAFETQQKALDWMVSTECNKYVVEYDGDGYPHNPSE